jgi:hypothetical protein
MIIENRQVKELIPSIKNIKKHPPKQINKIAESIRQFGFNNPLLSTNLTTVKKYYRYCKKT